MAKLTYDPPALVKLSGVFTTCLSLAGALVIYACALSSHVALADYYAFSAAYAMVTGASPPCLPARTASPRSGRCWTWCGPC